MSAVPLGLDAAVRIERAFARNSTMFVAAARTVDPSRVAASLPCAGGEAIFCGTGSPVSRAVAIAAGEAIDDASFDGLLGFYRGHGSPLRIELTFATDGSLLAKLATLRTRIVEFISILTLDLAGFDLAASPAPAGIEVEAVDPSDAATADLVDDTIGRGFNEGQPVPPLFRGLSRISLAKPGGMTALARIDGVAAGGGRLDIVTPAEGDPDRSPIALLTGASTLPPYRRRGVQRALLRARLARAVERGCRLAVIQARTGSTSERNIQRSGFAMGYGKVIGVEA
jgi:GNAT superfamily N-acetyltransferase